MRKLLQCIFPVILYLIVATSGLAQSGQFWIQIEVHGDMESAVERARQYSARITGVRGFLLSNGRYAVAIGTLTRSNARARRSDLVSRNLIPFGSFVTRGGHFVNQFWPVGGNGEETSASIRPEQPASRPAPRAPVSYQDSLTREQKIEIQTALTWLGFYDDKIDAMFGRNTRSAISAFQEAYDFPVTGQLDSTQHYELLREYDSETMRLGLTEFNEVEAGINLKMPTTMVQFSHYEPPFVIFDSVEPEGMELFLISMEGNRLLFESLFEILQDLEFIPVDGPRNIKGDEFTIFGEDEASQSFVYARLKGNTIKGFAVSWPTRLNDLMSRAILAMQASFIESDPKTLDSADVRPDPDSMHDLTAGLNIRQPRSTSSGVYLNTAGAVLTSASSVRDCAEIKLLPSIEAEIVEIDESLDLAILASQEPLSPLRIANLVGGGTAEGTKVAVSGFSLGGDLGAPTLSYGSIRQARDSSAENPRMVVSAKLMPGDIGGPVLDMSGNVVGVLLQGKIDNRILPEGMHVVASRETILDFASSAGINLSSAPVGTATGEAELNRIAADLTVLVECY